jgi:Xaa-Pro aminopeptidase
MTEPALTASSFVDDRVRAAGDLTASLGCAAALLSSAAAVRWTGGEGGLLLATGGETTPVEPTADALRRALADAGVGPGDAVAIERESLTLDIAAGLGNRRCPDVSGLLAVRRARKDPDEIELIERAAELLAVGQAEVWERAMPGATELELWAAAHTAMLDAAGGPVEAGVDLMAGERTALVGVPPTARRLERGEPVLFDLAPRRDGYWADSCVTLACDGAPDAALRRLVPGEPTVLDEGMVIAIEPGAYADGFGVRLEHVALIEADGARPLTTHALDL